MLSRASAWSSISVAVLAACSSGGDRGQPVVEVTTGALCVAIDTATGTGDVVQFLVLGAALERSDGAATGNLLAAAKPVTFTDPAGALAGLALQNVPAGEYRALHLLLAPDSGTVQHADGTIAPLRTSPDLAIPIADELVHDGVGATWLAVGHDLGETVVATASGLEWRPRLAGRLDDFAATFDGLQFLHAQDGELLAAWPTAGGATVHVELSASCAFTADDGVVARDQLLRRLGAGDDLRVEGTLQRDGRLLATHARATRHSDFPRLIGRIAGLDPAGQGFVLHLQAETRRGDRRVAAPRDVVVHAAHAVLHRPNAWLALTFADLDAGDLAVVRIAARAELAGGAIVVDAADVEVPRGAGECLHPEWQGRAVAVDVERGLITVAPRDGAAIVIDGVDVATAVVVVDANTLLLRREPSGSGRARIGLADVVPDVDRIWWRGAVIGPGAALAGQVFVRVR